VQHFSANQLTIWICLGLGLVVSVLLGSAVGSSDLRLVFGVLALIPTVIIFTKLKTNIWVLIPIGWYLTGRLPWLPLPLTVRDTCFLAAIGSYAVFFAMRTVPWKRKPGTLDYLIWINLAYLCFVFVRNPVGIWAFQSSMVGGRPYFEIAFAFGAFMVLSRAKMTAAMARVFPFFFLIPTMVTAFLDILSRFRPELSYPIASVYSGAGSLSLDSSLQQEATVGETRLTGMLSAGVSGVLYLCARYNPLSLISPLHPLRVALFFSALIAIFLSGFRSAILFAIAAFLLSAVLRRKAAELLVASGAAVVGLTLIVSLQGHVLQFPKTMQRSLSWLPGDWSEEAREDAEGSSRWRFEMWEWAWNDDRIMRDKVWGQGFGLSLDEMNIIANALLSGQQGAVFSGGSDREQFMITGTFHSGPLSTIKYIGIVGFALYYPLMCYMAVLAWRLCRRAQGTPVFSLTLFVGIPIMYEPFNFVFIFGGLDSNYSQLLFWAGLLNLVNNYLDAFERNSAPILPQDSGSSASAHGAAPV